MDGLSIGKEAALVVSVWELNRRRKRKMYQGVLFLF